MSCRVRGLAQWGEVLSHRDARALADQSVGWGLSQANCSPALHPQRTAVQPAPNLPLQERRELALPRSDCTRPSTLTNSQAEPSRLIELDQGPTGLGPFLRGRVRFPPKSTRGKKKLRREGRRDLRCLRGIH